MIPEVEVPFAGLDNHPGIISETSVKERHF
jgi:hypothetical protein